MKTFLSYFVACSFSMIIGFYLHSYLSAETLENQRGEYMVGQAGLIGLITSALMSAENQQGIDTQKFINGALVLEAEKYKAFAASSSHNSAEFVGSISETIEDYLIRNPSPLCASAPEQDVYQCEYNQKVGQLNNVLERVMMQPTQ